MSDCRFINYTALPPGTVSISATLITSPIGPYLYSFLPKIIRNASLFRRFLGLSIFNLISTALMALIHVTIDRSSGAVVIFGTIALLRSLQGCAVGIMYVFVQVSARFILLSIINQVWFFLFLTLMVRRHFLFTC